MKRSKKIMAAILAAFAMLNLAGCSENSERSLNTSSVDSQSVGDSQGSDTSSGKDDTSSIGSQSSNSQSSDMSSSPASSSSSTSSSSSSQSSSIQSPEPSAPGDSKPQNNPTPPLNSASTNTENSIRLFDVISADKKNAMFSPLSLNMALGLVEAGAKGDTKAQLDMYLQTENYMNFAEEYLEFIKKYRTKEEIVYSWGESYPASVLEIANSLWADKDLPVKDAYKQSVSQKFGAEIQNVDFGNETETLEKINGWVNEKTHEMIPSVLSKIDPLTLAVLVNTVYFESNWNFEWFINENKKESFTLTDGTVKELPLMYGSADSYFENNKATAFRCSYRNGIDFIGILPKKAGDFTLESLGIPSLLKNESYDYDVSAVMPRLKFDTDFQLGDALRAAGLNNAFDINAADFSGISDMPLHVSEVIQKTSIELDENGTKASAATAVPMEGGGVSEIKGKKTVRLDRPFAFLIYDKKQDQILFMGKVTEP